MFLKNCTLRLLSGLLLSSYAPTFPPELHTQSYKRRSYAGAPSVPIPGLDLARCIGVIEVDGKTYYIARWSEYRDLRVAMSLARGYACFGLDDTPSIPPTRPKACITLMHLVRMIMQNNQETQSLRDAAISSSVILSAMKCEASQYVRREQYFEEGVAKLQAPQDATGYKKAIRMLRAILDTHELGDWVSSQGASPMHKLITAYCEVVSALLQESGELLPGITENLLRCCRKVVINKELHQCVECAQWFVASPKVMSAIFARYDDHGKLYRLLHTEVPREILECKRAYTLDHEIPAYKDWVAESVITTTDIFLSLPDHSLANPIYKIYKSLLQGAAQENPDGVASALSGALTDLALSQPPRATCPVYRDILCIMSEKAITDSLLTIN